MNSCIKSCWWERVRLGLRHAYWTNAKVVLHLDEKRLSQVFERKETWCGLRGRKHGEKLKTEFRHTFQEMLL